MGSCREKAILFRDMVGQTGMILCRDKGFVGRDRVSQARSFLSRQSVAKSWFCVVT